MNFYAYANDNSISLIDPLGLQAKGGWGTLPPNPKANTHVCDGHGGQMVQLGSPGTPELAACLGDCMRVHEETHIRDSMAGAPKNCVGKPAGTLVGSWGQTHDNTEVAASNAEIDCLKDKLKKEQCGGGSCTNIINDRIKQMEGYRDKRGPYRSR